MINQWWIARQMSAILPLSHHCHPSLPSSGRARWAQAASPLQLWGIPGSWPWSACPQSCSAGGWGRRHGWQQHHYQGRHKQTWEQPAKGWKHQKPGQPNSTEHFFFQLSVHTAFGQLALISLIQTSLKKPFWKNFSCGIRHKRKKQSSCVSLILP